MKSNTFITIIISMVFVLLSSSSLANNGRDRATDSPVNSFVTGELIDGTSSVYRHKNNVMFNLNSRSLTPGNAYTFWIMHFDKPRRCLDRCACTLDDFANPNVVGGFMGAMAGRVADSSGQISVSNIVDYGFLPQGSGQALLPNPIKNKRSHFILALRDHGPASTDPVILEEQLSSYFGGCDTFACNDVVISDHKSPYCR